MFRDSSSFNADISSWNVSKVLNMQSIFANYLGASSANYPNSFNQNISGWSINPSATISNFGSSSGHSDYVFASSSQYYFTINQVTISQSTIQTAVNDWISNPTNATAKYGGVTINNWDVSTVTNMDSLFENQTSFAGGANIFGIGDDLPANFGEIGGTHVNGPKAILYWAYDQNDGNIIVSTEDNATSLKMIKISQDGTIASVIFEQPLNNNQYIDLTHPVRVANITTVRSAADLINVYNNPLQAGSHLLYTFEKGTGFDDITFGDNSVAGWNVSNVTSMQNMFKGATDFNSDISQWDVSNVTNMDSLFENNTSIFLRKFGTHNLGDIEIHSSYTGALPNTNAVGYWAFDRNDNTIVVGALVREASTTHFIMNRLDLRGNAIDNGKYSPLGYGSSTWTPTINSEQDLLNIYSTATTSGGVNPDGGPFYMFAKGASFPNDLSKMCKIDLDGSYIDNSCRIGDMIDITNESELKDVYDNATNASNDFTFETGVNYSFLPENSEEAKIEMYVDNHLMKTFTPKNKTGIWYLGGLINRRKDNDGPAVYISSPELPTYGKIGEFS